MWQDRWDKKAGGFDMIFATLMIVSGLSLLLTACGDSTTATTAPAPTSSANTAPATSTLVPPTATTTPALPTATTAPTVAPTNPPAPTSAPTTAPAATPPATGLTQPLAKDEQEISFGAGKDTIYGTLLIPQNSATGKLPAALLLSGSGPTDRNGNTPLIPGAVNSHLNFARVLADQGVISLRYDKLGSGKTGLAVTGTTTPTEIGFSTFVEEARAAYDYLKNRPEVDPNRILILGHSEGGLIALVVADQLKASNQPKALILAAPLSRPYLQTIRDQIAAQYEQAQKSGAVTKEQAEAGMSELDAIIKSLTETGKQPATISNPAFKPLFNPVNDKFFAEVSKYDPQKLAAGLPATLPALAMCGQKDIQVLCSDVQYLMQGFQKAGNTKATFSQLANVNHVFKEVPGTPNPNVLLDYANPNLIFSSEATGTIAAFVKTNL